MSKKYIVFTSIFAHKIQCTLFIAIAFSVFRLKISDDDTKNLSFISNAVKLED